MSIFPGLRFKLDLGPIPLILGVIFGGREDKSPRAPEREWENELIRMIFFHLVHNSSKADATEVTIATRQEGANIIIDIADNGYGIPKQFEPSLFGEKASLGHSHFRSKDGLGLFYCRRDIKKMGGTIELHRNVPSNEATPNDPHGVTFRLTLPINP